MKEFRDRFIQGKTPLMLSKVHDIHVVCGLLKDFLRKLKEPLITFRLHRTFMEASGVNTGVAHRVNLKLFKLTLTVCLKNVGDFTFLKLQDLE